MKRPFLAVIFLLQATIAFATTDTLKVDSFRYAGPFPVQTPFMLDSTDVDRKAFDMKKILESQGITAFSSSAKVVGSIQTAEKNTLNYYGFSIETMDFSELSVSVQGIGNYVLVVDGDKTDGKSLAMDPGTHEVVLGQLVSLSDTASGVSVVVKNGGPVTLRSDGHRLFSLDLNTQGSACRKVSISPEGGYVALVHTMTGSDGKTSQETEVIRRCDGITVIRTRDGINWMPRRDAFWRIRKTPSGRDLAVTDMATGQETVLASSIPDGKFTISPSEDFLIYDVLSKGPKEGEVHQIVTPDDRQSGWRDRKGLARYDIASGILQPVTFGYRNAILCDISDDGSRILFMSSRERLTQRPTQLYSLYLMDACSLSTTCIVEDDGFIDYARFSPDASKVLVGCSPEAFGGICTSSTLKSGQIPNIYDKQLAVLDIASRKVTPITIDFAPSVLSAVWSRFDGKIYLNTEDRDCRHLFRMDSEGRHSEMLPVSEDNVQSFDIACSSPVLVYSGQSLMNGSRAYEMNLKSKGFRQTLLHDWSCERIGGVTMGEGKAYDFVSSRGDNINTFYVLPPDFDPSKKYPLLVHYYGGCSPSARYCIGSYSPQYYAAQGYVFLVVNPSGAAGFGQEFAARHVNTAGDVVADDIIEATERFCEDHPFVDKQRIGCFSASYGGFMTQLLLTKTDIYRVGISHAGISSHTSYWGEGYWGYSYSEVCMAGSYPWTRKDLYVDRSPLYNADKIHTPLLFLHGSKDTNVPIGESIQMFTALKLLGEDTAFVVIDGENHGISDYAKRRQWLRTISAWFAKYLKGDPAWWNHLYPEKNL